LSSDFDCASGARCKFRRYGLSRRESNGPATHTRPRAGSERGAGKYGHFLGHHNDGARARKDGDTTACHDSAESDASIEESVPPLKIVTIAPLSASATLAAADPAESREASRVCPALIGLSVVAC